MAEDDEAGAAEADDEEDDDEVAEGTCSLGFDLLSDDETAVVAATIAVLDEEGVVPTVIDEEAVDLNDCVTLFHDCVAPNKTEQFIQIRKQYTMLNVRFDKHLQFVCNKRYNRVWSDSRGCTLPNPVLAMTSIFRFCESKKSVCEERRL